MLFLPRHTLRIVLCHYKNSMLSLFAGYGTYSYENKYFKYEGEWQDGQKHGK